MHSSSDPRRGAAPMISGNADAVAALGQEIEGLAQELRNAEAITHGGTLVDLTGLDAEVARLCAAAKALPKREAAALAPPLAGLLAAMDALTAAVRSQHGAVTAQIKGLGTRKQAVKAYGKPPAAPRR